MIAELLIPVEGVVMDRVLDFAARSHEVGRHYDIASITAAGMYVAARHNR